MRIIHIFAILFIICFVSMILIAIFSHGEPKKEMVDCYDKYGSKIIGQSCEKIESPMPIIFWVVFGLDAVLGVICLGGIDEW